MALKWRKENGCNDDTDKNAEMCVTMRMHSDFLKNLT